MPEAAPASARHRPRVGNWLRAGQPLESPHYRQEVRELLGLSGHPQLLLEFGPRTLLRLRRAGGRLN